MEQEKNSIVGTIIYWAVGALFYFAYYVVMVNFFEVAVFSLPYLILSVYFAVCSVLFPFSARKLSIMQSEAEKTNFWLNFITIPQTVLLIAYLFAPFIASIKLPEQ